jgi:hypothetical protein
MILSYVLTLSGGDGAVGTTAFGFSLQTGLKETGNSGSQSMTGTFVYPFLWSFLKATLTLIIGKVRKAIFGKYVKAWRNLMITCACGNCAIRSPLGAALDTVFASGALSMLQPLSPRLIRP